MRSFSCWLHSTREKLYSNVVLMLLIFFFIDRIQFEETSAQPAMTWTKCTSSSYYDYEHFLWCKLSVMVEVLLSIYMNKHTHAHFWQIHYAFCHLNTMLHAYKFHAAISTASNRLFLLPIGLSCTTHHHPAHKMQAWAYEFNQKLLLFDIYCGYVSESHNCPHRKYWNHLFNDKKSCTG